MAEPTTPVEQNAYEPLPLVFERLASDEQLRRSRAFLATMAQRRSCRFFSRAPVERELIANAVRAAGTSPSGANQQPWTFVVVESADTKAAIRDAAEVEEKAFYEEGSAAWRAALAPLGTDAVKEHITDAPYVIVVFAQIHGFEPGDAVPVDAGQAGEAGEAGEKDEPRERSSVKQVKQVKHYYVRESVGIACGLLIASLTHAGLVTLPHTPSPMGFLAKLLGRPENERAVLLMPVGLPAEGATVPRHAMEKKALEEILVWR